MERRHYPQGVVLHSPNCVDGGNAPVVPADYALREFPSHQYDVCIGEGAPFYVVEEIPFPTHGYAPGDVFPEDAVRPLCMSCRGTHPEQS